MKNSTSKSGLIAILFVLALFMGACALKAQNGGNSPAPKPNCSITASGKLNPNL